MCSIWFDGCSVGVIKNAGNAFFVATIGVELYGRRCYWISTDFYLITVRLTQCAIKGKNMNTLGIDDDSYLKLLADWDNGLKNKEIIEKYDLSIKSNALIKHIIPLEMEKECPYCHVNLFLPKRKREKIGYSNAPFCKICDHEESGFKCSCRNCKEEEIEKEKLIWEEKLQNVLALNKKLEEPIVFNSLSLESRLWILSMVNSMTAEKLDYLMAVNSVEIPIYPNADLVLEKIKIFIDDGILHTIGFDKKEIKYRHDLQVYYTDLIFKLNTDISLKELYDTIKGEKLLLPDSEDEIDVIEQQLLIDEVYEIINWNMSKIGFDFNPGDKTHLLVNRLLKKYDYFRISSMVYSCANNSLRYVKENPTNRRHAFNIFIANLERYYLKSIEEEWEIKPSFRQKECAVTSYRLILEKVIGKKT